MGSDLQSCSFQHIQIQGLGVVTDMFLTTPDADSLNIGDTLDEFSEENQWQLIVGVICGIVATIAIVAAVVAVVIKYKERLSLYKPSMAAQSGESLAPIIAY